MTDIFVEKVDETTVCIYNHEKFSENSVFVKFGINGEIALHIRDVPRFIEEVLKFEKDSNRFYAFGESDFESFSYDPTCFVCNHQIEENTEFMFFWTAPEPDKFVHKDCRIELLEEIEKEVASASFEEVL